MSLTTFKTQIKNANVIVNISINLTNMEEIKSGDKQGASGDDLPSIQKESSSKDVKRRRNRASPKGRKQTHIDYNKKRKVKLAQKLENQKDKLRAMVTAAAERAYEFGYQAGMVDRNVFKND